MSEMHLVLTIGVISILNKPMLMETKHCFLLLIILPFSFYFNDIFILIYLFIYFSVITSTKKENNKLVVLFCSFLFVCLFVFVI